ncbi:hypothetical protein BpHYR1_028451 [Brachionus plicatilis]|uniref:Uncharacterized protein n=1 Tax=Brachionus plicatilis TaxID=10195 RepID=A0A3M7QCL8_BRAPC|nr:hypothetical protein BpHYR1_028451 [Brachionus plicatilis]
MPFKKPAHSRLTYEAPTQSVFPGLYGNENKQKLKSKEKQNQSFVQNLQSDLGIGLKVRNKIMLKI